MSKLVWDQVCERFYETGTKKGVLYVQSNGTYPLGVAWNGLTAVNESPEGAEANDIYADDIKYLTLRSAENFKATPAAMAHAQDHHSSDGVFIFPVPVGLILLSFLCLSERCFGAFALIVSGSEISALVSESLITRAHFRNSASSPVFTLYMSSCFSSFVSTSSKNGSDRNISRRSAPSEERQTDSGELLYGRRQNLIYEPSSSVKTYSGSRTIADGLIRLSSSSGTEQKKSPADLLLSSKSFESLFERREPCNTALPDCLTDIRPEKSK